MPQTLLVTGGTGFIMANVARHWLESDATARCIVLDSTPPDGKAVAFFEPVADRLAVVTGSVTDRGLLDTVAETHAPDAIVHGATVTSMKRLLTTADGRAGLDGALDALATNIMGTAEILALACRLPTRARIIYCSSGSVYGMGAPHVADGPVSEDVALQPDGFYGATKAASERLVEAARIELGLEAASVRFSGVFGPMDRETPHRAVENAVMAMIRRARMGRPIRVHSPDAVCDYVYAPDIADALARMLRADSAPRHTAYNVAGGRADTLADVFAAVASCFPNAELEITQDDTADIAMDPSVTGARFNAYDVSRMKDEYGWAPRPLADAARDYVERG